MSKHKRSDNSAQETLEGQQNRISLIVGFLQHLALPSVFNRELTEEDYALWEKLLLPYPEAAIEYAFDNWGRNGKQWPKPSNILELIAAWNLSLKTGKRDVYEHHGEGYGEADVLALWHLYQRKNQEVGGRTLNDVEIECLFDALDKKRGVSPGWRK